MQYFWLNKKNNTNLIVFMNGWAMNETPIKHLNCENFDVLVLFDYRCFEIDLKQFEFEKYKNKYLICWSMGVYASSLFKENFDMFDKKIAINGTRKIIDNNFGIAEKIYKATIKFLNEDSCDKFIKNMFDNGRINPNITITKTINELKEELISIQNIKLEKEIEFDKAIISKNDKIVPANNQINFWKNRAKEVKLINSTHCPFENYTSWRELLC